MDNYVINNVLEQYERLQQRSPSSGVTWVEMTEDELWFQICFCILSSNVPFEMAQSATSHLVDLDLIDRKWLIQFPQALEKWIAGELSQPCFLPPRKDGTRRKYRFPHIRANCIVRTALNLQQTSIRDTVRVCETDSQAREFLVNNVRGMGLKESSMFLRNIGYSAKLAVIDTHILRFMKMAGLIKARRYNTQRQNTYLCLEALLRNFALAHRLEMPILDLAIWKFMRGEQT